MEDIKLNNKKAWPTYKPLITLNKVVKYKNLKDAKLHLKLCLQEPQKVFFEVDGVELFLYYEKGILKHAINKSNEDIYSNAIYFKGVPTSIKSKAPNLIVKGLITISKENFEKVKNDYSTERYAAAGISRRLDSFNTDLIEFYADSIYQNNELDNKLYKASVESSEQIFKENDFITYSNIWNLSSKESKEEQLTSIYSKLKNISNTINYNIMDIYIKHDNYEFRLMLEQDSANTIIESYKWSLTSTNKLIPVAIFKPVEIQNTIITKATLTSARNYIMLDAPVGSTIEVEKTDGVLPYIKGLKEKVGELEIPKKCPLCNSNLEWKGAHLVCNNIKCKNRLLSDCNRALEVLKIPRFTMSLIENLIEDGSIKSSKDLFTLTVEDITSVKFLNKSISLNQAKTLINNINEKRKSLTESDFIYLLNLPKISKLIIKKLEKEAQKENITLLELFEQCNISILSKVLQESKIKTILDFMQNNKDIYNRFKVIIFNNRD